MFEGQPKGLWALALANTGERFGYYTMLAVFTLFLQANFGFDEKLTSTIFSTFLGLVYFLPLIGGILADKFGSIQKGESNRVKKENDNKQIYCFFVYIVTY